MLIAKIIIFPVLVLSLFFAAGKAFAAESGYRSLKKVSLSKPQQPRLKNGFAHLAQNESRYLENLPMQLNGAVKAVETRKYNKRRYQ